MASWYGRLSCITWLEVAKDPCTTWDFVPIIIDEPSPPFHIMMSTSFIRSRRRRSQSHNSSRKARVPFIMNRKMLAKTSKHQRSLDGSHHSPLDSFEDLDSLDEGAQLSETVPSPDHIVDGSESSYLKPANKAKEQPLPCDCSMKRSIGADLAKSNQTLSVDKGTTPDFATDEPSKLVAEMNQHYEKRVQGSSSIPSIDPPHDASPSRTTQSFLPVATSSNVQPAAEKHRRLCQPRRFRKARAAHRGSRESLESTQSMGIGHDNAAENNTQRDRTGYKVPGKWPQQYIESVAGGDIYSTSDVDSIESNTYDRQSQANASHKVLTAQGCCCPTCGWKSMRPEYPHFNPWHGRPQTFSDEEIRLMVTAPVVALLLTLPAAILVSAHIRGTDGDNNEVTLIFCFTVMFGSFMSMYVQVERPEMWAASYAAVLVAVWCMLRIK